MVEASIFRSAIWSFELVRLLAACSWRHRRSAETDFRAFGPSQIFELRTLADFHGAYGFRSALDDIFGVAEERVLADRECWWIEPSWDESASGFRLLDLLHLIL
jgi:hypothetical protein